MCGLRMTKATKGYDRLLVEVHILQNHMVTLERPDANTHDADKSFRYKLNDIESEILDILDRYPSAMSQQSF